MFKYTFFSFAFSFSGKKCPYEYRYWLCVQPKEGYSCSFTYQWKWRRPQKKQCPSQTEITAWTPVWKPHHWTDPQTPAGCFSDPLSNLLSDTHTYSRPWNTIVWHQLTQSEIKWKEKVRQHVPSFWKGNTFTEYKYISQLIHLKQAKLRKKQKRSIIIF